MRLATRENTGIATAIMILPREYETDFNKSSLIGAVTALLAVIAILSTATRLVTRHVIMGVFKADDTLISTATVSFSVPWGRKKDFKRPWANPSVQVIAIIQSVLVYFESLHGLGKYQDVLQASDISFILKVCQLYSYYYELLGYRLIRRMVRYRQNMPRLCYLFSLYS